MTGYVIAAGFVGMVLAPCAIGLYSKWGEFAEISSDRAPAVPSSVTSVEAVKTETIAVPAAAPLLSTSAVLIPPVPIVRAPATSLREVAERAEAEMRSAQTKAANAKAAYLVELSRTASRRAEAAARLAEAAELELQRASRALQMAEANKARTRQMEDEVAQDYLPHDHPSLDFPRSRVSHRAA